MRQRVAVARALAMQPEILLLDEPLSALDALTRAKLQDEIAAIWEKEKRTVLLITNDVDEAILLADRIIPLMPGPNATLGREFKVDLPRPRDRTEINADPEFKRLRQAVTGYLDRYRLPNGRRSGDDNSPAAQCRADHADGQALPAAYAKAAASSRAKALSGVVAALESLSDAERAAEGRGRLRPEGRARASSSR